MVQESKPDQGEASSYPEINSVKPTDDTPYIQPIIGKLGWDTRKEYKGLFGLGSSPNNGVDFHVFLSFDGVNFDDDAIDTIWNNGTADKVKQEVNSATAEIPSIESTANEAVKRADSAVAASKVNSDAQVAMNSAIDEAKATADSAMSSIQQAVANASSDATKIRSDVAKVQGEVNTANTAIEQNKAAIALKADQATVDSLSGEVSQNKAQLKVQADQISSKVSSEDFKTLGDKVNGMKIGGRNYILNSAKQVFSPAGQDNYDLCWSVSKEAFNANPDKNGQYKTHFSFNMQASSALPIARTWRIYWRASPWTSFGTITYPANTTNVQHYELKITTPANQPINDQIFIRFMKEDTGEPSYTITNSLLTIGDVFEDYSPNPDDTIAAINKNTTAINQTNQKISLKADQTEVDTVKNTASQNSSRLDTMANEIQSKVTSTDVNNIVDGKGYATTNTVQSLVTQKADEWNLNLTNLKTDVNAIKTNGGGVNLLQGTRDFSDVGIAGDKVAVTNGGEKFQAAFGTQNSSQASFDLVNFYSIPLEKDTDYTASFWVKTSEDIDITSYFFDSGSNGFYSDGGTVNHSTTDYTRIVVHFHNGNNSATPSFIPARIQKAGVTVWVYGCMLEKGTVAHDWSPAPSDMATVTSVTNLSASVDGLQSTVQDKADKSSVTQLTNIVQSKVSSKDYQTTISQLTNDINAKVAKGDLISQINIEAGQTLIQSKKLFLDADSVIFSGKAFIPNAAIENLSLDKLTTGHITIPLTDKFGNEIELGSEGIEITSAYSTGDDKESSDQKDKSAFKLRLSSNGVTFANQIEYGDTSKHLHKSDEYQFLNLCPDILHNTNGDTDMVLTPSGMTMYVPVNYSSDLGPSSPGGFFALGHETTSEANGTDRGIDIAYVTKPINGWAAGLNVRTSMHIFPPGADHDILATWVSWSNWDGGEKYPALVQNGPNWGGIAFPKSGRVTLFDDNGHYYTPDRNTGIGSYNNFYGG